MAPTKKTDEVKARFGGRDLVFKIERTDMVAFERAINRPVIFILDQMNAGRWTAHDVEFILNWAAPEGLSTKPARGDELDMFGPDSIAAMKEYLTRRQQAARGEKPGAPKLTFVEAVLAENGHGKYAVLAQAILGAALFGLPEDGASFSDEEADDDAA